MLPIVRYSSLLLGLALASARSTGAGTNLVSGTPVVRPITVGDPFVEEEQRSRSWLSYPGPELRGWQLTLRLPTNTFELGKPIAATVVFQNTTTNTLRLYVSSPGMPYLFYTFVTDAGGKDVPVNDEVREEMEHGHPTLGTFHDVAARSGLAFPVELEHFYRFGKAGVYGVHATSRRLPVPARWIPGDPAGAAQASTGTAQIRLISPKANDPPTAPP
ncbi:exported hypothetical protein [Verrucomicrobia bacterium]|nr:exported hypothetical protein [Verrucomicrobiota bacterium]